MLKRGVTLLEVLVVIAIVAVASAMLVPTNLETVTLAKLSAEAKLVSQRLVQLSVDARVSGRIVKLNCSPQGLTADSYVSPQTRDYNTAKSAASPSTSPVESFVVESTTNGILLNGICLSSQTFYITSEGYFFSAQGVPGIANIELRAGTLAASIDVSGAGSTTVRVGTVGAINNEI